MLSQKINFMKYTLDTLLENCIQMSTLLEKSTRYYILHLNSKNTTQLKHANRCSGVEEWNEW